MTTAAPHIAKTRRSKNGCPKRQLRRIFARSRSAPDAGKGRGRPGQYGGLTGCDRAPKDGEGGKVDRGGGPNDGDGRKGDPDDDRSECDGGANDGDGANEVDGGDANDRDADEGEGEGANDDGALRLDATGVPNEEG
jgi:hypothetical protein